MNLYKTYIELILEDYKSKRQEYINQGNKPEIVDFYISEFRDFVDRAYQDILNIDFKKSIKNQDEFYWEYLEHFLPHFPVLHDFNVPVGNARKNIDNYSKFEELKFIIDFTTKVKKFGEVNKDNSIDIEGQIVYDDEDFEVYQSNSLKSCVKYKGDRPYTWCIASPGQPQFWQYRHGEGTPAFYFILDKKLYKKQLDEGLKGPPFKYKFHIIVVQVFSETHKFPGYINLDDKYRKYKVTTANNGDDRFMSWYDILKINNNYNKLYKFLVPVPLTQKQVDKYKKFRHQKLTKEEFLNLSYNDKYMFITFGGLLSNDTVSVLDENLLLTFINDNRRLPDDVFQKISKKLKYQYIRNMSKRKTYQFIDNDISSFYNFLSTLDDNEYQKLFEIILKVGNRPIFRNEFFLKQLSDENKNKYIDYLIDNNILYAQQDERLFAYFTEEHFIKILKIFAESSNEKNWSSNHATLINYLKKFFPKLYKIYELFIFTKISPYDIPYIDELLKKSDKEVVNIYRKYILENSKEILGKMKLYSWRNLPADIQELFINSENVLKEYQFKSLKTSDLQEKYIKICEGEFMKAINNENYNWDYLKSIFSFKIINKDIKNKYIDKFYINNEYPNAVPAIIFQSLDEKNKNLIIYKKFNRYVTGDQNLTLSPKENLYIKQNLKTLYELFYTHNFFDTPSKTTDLKQNKVKSKLLSEIKNDFNSYDEGLKNIIVMHSFQNYPDLFYDVTSFTYKYNFFNKIAKYMIDSVKNYVPIQIGHPIIKKQLWDLMDDKLKILFIKSLLGNLPVNRESFNLSRFLYNSIKYMPWVVQYMTQEQKSILNKKLLVLYPNENLQLESYKIKNKILQEISRIKSMIILK